MENVDSSDGSISSNIRMFIVTFLFLLSFLFFYHLLLLTSHCHLCYLNFLVPRFVTQTAVYLGEYEVVQYGEATAELELHL